MIYEIILTWSKAIKILSSIIKDIPQVISFDTKGNDPSVNPLETFLKDLLKPSDLT